MEHLLYENAMSSTEITNEVFIDYLNELKYVSGDQGLKHEFLDKATILEHEYENCPVRQEMSLKRRSSISTKRMSVPDYNSRVENAIPVSDRYDSTYVPSPPRNREIEVVQKTDAKRVTCSDCNGRKQLRCGCGDGLERCPQCGGDQLVRCGNCSGDGFYDCGKCGGKGYKKCPECGGWTSSSEPENCSTCPGSQKIPCSNNNCHNGSITCQKCTGGNKPCLNCDTGTVTCRNCEGTRTVDCSTCKAHGELVTCDSGHVNYTVTVDSTKVASKKGMPIEKIGQEEPTDVTVDMADTGENGDGIVQTGTKEWRVPTHRMTYELEDDDFTFHKIGNTFDDDDRPALVYQNIKKKIKRRSLFGTILGGLLSIPLLTPFDYAPWVFVGLFAATAMLYDAVTKELPDIEFTDRSVEPYLHVNAGFGAIALYWVAFGLPVNSALSALVAGITGVAALLTQIMSIPAIPRLLDFPKSAIYKYGVWLEVLVAASVGGGLSVIVPPNVSIPALGLLVVWIVTALGFSPPVKEEE